MVTLASAAADFLAAKRIAVTGVSRNPAGHGGNAVFDRLVERGYEVFPINPNAESVAGSTAYPNLAAVPGGVDAVVIATSPEHALGTVEEAVQLGIGSVWMHRSIDGGSVSPAAVTYGREHGVRVIDGGCPLMFDPTADGAHKVMCTILTLFGRVPRQVS
jgi:predicted CoA-binding protein